MCSQSILQIWVMKTLAFVRTENLSESRGSLRYSMVGSVGHPADTIAISIVLVHCKAEVVRPSPVIVVGEEAAHSSADLAQANSSNMRLTFFLSSAISGFDAEIRKIIDNAKSARLARYARLPVASCGI